MPTPGQARVMFSAVAFALIGSLLLLPSCSSSQNAPATKETATLTRESPPDTPLIYLELAATPSLTLTSPAKLPTTESAAKSIISLTEEAVGKWRLQLEAPISLSLHFKNAGDKPLTITDTWWAHASSCA